MYVGRNAWKVSLLSGEEEDWNFGSQWKHQIVSWLFQTFVLIILRTLRTLSHSHRLQPTLINSAVDTLLALILLTLWTLAPDRVQWWWRHRPGYIHPAGYIWHWPVTPPLPNLWNSPGGSLAWSSHRCCKRWSILLSDRRQRLEVKVLAQENKGAWFSSCQSLILVEDLVITSVTGFGSRLKRYTKPTHWWYPYLCSLTPPPIPRHGGGAVNLAPAVVLQKGTLKQFYLMTNSEGRKSPMFGGQTCLTYPLFIWISLTCCGIKVYVKCWICYAVTLCSGDKNGFLKVMHTHFC